MLAVSTRQTLSLVILPGMSVIAPPGIWTVDAARSSVGWSVKHLGVSTVHGTAGEFAGTLEDGRATGTVAAASLQTDDPKRDDYVRSAGVPRRGRRSRSCASRPTCRARTGMRSRAS